MARRRRRKKQTSKSQGQEIHALRRLLERWDLVIGRDGYKALCGQIQHGVSLYIGPGATTRCTKHIVKYRKFLLPVVYDKRRKSIVTFLPEHELTRALRHQCTHRAITEAFTRWGIEVPE